MSKPRLGKRQRQAKRNQAEAIRLQALERKLAIEAMAFQGARGVRNSHSKFDRAYPQSGTMGGGGEAKQQQVYGRKLGRVKEGGAIMSQPIWPTAKQSKRFAKDGYRDNT